MKACRPARIWVCLLVFVGAKKKKEGHQKKRNSLNLHKQATDMQKTMTNSPWHFSKCMYLFFEWDEKIANTVRSFCEVELFPSLYAELTVSCKWRQTNKFIHNAKNYSTIVCFLANQWIIKLINNHYCSSRVNYAHHNALIPLNMETHHPSVIVKQCIWELKSASTVSHCFSKLYK